MVLVLVFMTPVSSPSLCASFPPESEFTHDAFCMSECRKEKEEREYYCYSEFGTYATFGYLSQTLHRLGPRPAPDHTHNI